MTALSLSMPSIAMPYHFAIAMVAGFMNRSMVTCIARTISMVSISDPSCKTSRGKTDNSQA